MPSYCVLFRTWDIQKECRFLAARYNLTSIDTKLLKPQVLEIIAALALFGFLVNTVVGISASEDCLCMRQLVTITAPDALGSLSGLIDRTLGD